ncbi:MAG: hypothetical protein WB660_15140 [Candidatus Sulfotelmatobacter sp.]
MIARIWHGKTKASDADAYLDYLFKSGIPATVQRLAIGGLGFTPDGRGYSALPHT